LKLICSDGSDLDIALKAWTFLEQNAMQKALDSIETYCKKSDIADEEKELIMRDLDDYKDTWHKFRQNSTSETLPSFRQFAAMGFNNQQRQKGLTLATVHTVKGLEYDIVFVVGMTQGTFPDYRAVTEKAIEEEKNNANVAFTRARRWLFVSYPKRKTTYWGNIKIQQKSQFLQ
jgi:DNA helicase II / ATP-dependent DNA helicase PcrA